MSEHDEYRAYLWMTPTGDLFITTETMTFDLALFSVSDCTDPESYRPICSKYLLEKLGCECLCEV